MAIKNGRCHNCGSIIRVDDKKDVAICIFCNAKTDPQTAIEIEKNPDAYTFPNEKQEELTEDEKEVAFQGYRKVSDQNLRKAQLAAEAAHARAKKSQKPSPSERVAELQTKPLKVNPLSTKQILALLGGIIVIIGIILAIALPMALERDSKREILSDNINSILTFDLQKDGGHYSFEGNKNKTLRVVSPEKIVVNSDEAAKIYENFQTARGNAYEMTNPEEQELRVVIAGEEQSFEVKNGVVTELKPQPVVQAGEDAK
ncbi:MAG: hypothetical protein ACOYCB_00205 [Fastidiosipilaceae bacterium]|jgi:hypothetical protein|nr:hypothetical protein [Clostridiaceae bacterium]